MSFYLVAVDAPLKEALTYLPLENGTTLVRGDSVLVPLGKRVANGVVLDRLDSQPTSDAIKTIKLKAVLEKSLERPTIPSAYMDWLEWLARYYLYPIGLVMASVFPPLKKTGRGSKKSAAVKDYLEKSLPPALTFEQNQVLEKIQMTAGFKTHLIHGVTGSGKTEVYLNLLEQALNDGGCGLVLVPEISLTPQLIDRFSKRFPAQVAVLHSHLTPREKTTQWWSIVNGERKILIGARSALFCPIPNLKIIVLDEEHEPSYKQDEKLKYHARDAAVVLAKNLNIPLVLGSATPSLESWNNAQQEKYFLHVMKNRVNQLALPDIEVVDLREVQKARKDTASELPFWLSDQLFSGLSEVFNKKEQAALFLNRRGVAQTAQCHACGFVNECPNCSVSLTLHGKSHLVCHYCDYSERLKEICPDCKEAPLEALGLGTERVEQDIAKLFPNLRIARADRDEIQSREELEKLISDMEDSQTDLLIGTQMIAKGLDFQKLNLVGLVLADIGFHWPDFRASERSFQLLTQVAGRSGRQTAGKVIIQTFNPDHVSIDFTVKGDFKAFADSELNERREMLYPPIWRMAMLRIQGQSAETTERAANLLTQRARALQSAQPIYSDNLVVLGPAQAPLFKLRNTFRYQVLIKCDSSKKLNYFCRQLLSNEDWLPEKTKVQVDIDPYQML